MKLIIAGGRDFKDYEYLKDKVNHLTSRIKITEIVNGCQVSEEQGDKFGADYLAQRYAIENNIPIAPFPADWDKYGKPAGPIRNTEMAKYADICIVFWDGRSRGSSDMIDKAKKYNVPVKVCYY